MLLPEEKFTKKSIIYSNLTFSDYRLASRKGLMLFQEFLGSGHWDCKLVFFDSYTGFQSRGSNVTEKIWVVHARSFFA